MVVNTHLEQIASGRQQQWEATNVFITGSVWRDSL